MFNATERVLQADPFVPAGFAILDEIDLKALQTEVESKRARMIRQVHESASMIDERVGHYSIFRVLIAGPRQSTGTCTAEPALGQAEDGPMK